MVIYRLPKILNHIKNCHCRHQTRSRSRYQNGLETHQHWATIPTICLLFLLWSINNIVAFSVPFLMGILTSKRMRLISPSVLYVLELSFGMYVFELSLCMLVYEFSFCVYANVNPFVRMYNLFFCLYRSQEHP